MSDIIRKLDHMITSHTGGIDAWLAARAAEKAPQFYTSVDLRHSGFKIAPVDTNLFPAGFHVLSPAAAQRAVAQFKRVLSAYGEKPKLLLIPENHTRNLTYLDNVATLAELLGEAGAQVRIGSLIATPGEPLALTSLSGRSLTELPLKREGTRLVTEDGFDPDLILLNNDLTAGMPDLLRGVTQPMLPPAELGWWRRRKSAHFAAYEKLTRQFAEQFAVDPWLMGASFQRCGLVNFGERSGLECVALNVEKVLHQVKRKYEEHGISETPYVYIKADSGTYGMGIMTAHSGDELYEMNKKTRNKMNVIKEGAQNSEVIIQEGIPSIDQVRGAVAEPMIYLVGGEPVGGAYRTNPERDKESNLNASGMVFTGMCDEAENALTSKVTVPNCNFRVFGLIARLAALAAAREEYQGGD